MSNKAARNAEIYQAWKNGYKQTEVARMFGLTNKRVGQIIRRLEFREQRGIDPMYDALVDAAKRLGKGENLVNRAYNQLQRRGYITIESVMDATDEAIADIRNIGVNTLEVINEARKKVD